VTKICKRCDLAFELLGFIVTDINEDTSNGATEKLGSKLPTGEEDTKGTSNGTSNGAVDTSGKSDNALVGENDINSIGNIKGKSDGTSEPVGALKKSHGVFMTMRIQ
jgi:hypothetical protein